MSLICKNICITLNKNEEHDERILFQNFNCSVQKGTVLTIMGRSGTGKSTLFNYITGIYDHVAFNCSGEVEVDNINILQKKTEHRKIGLLSQEGLLFPHMTVRENFLYASPNRIHPQLRQEYVQNILEEAQLDSSFANKYPHTLSGGQQARLALARAILSEPHILLLDEPFSKLDAELREDMRKLVWGKVKQANIPALLITHDKEDVFDTKLLYILEAHAN